MSDVPGGAPMAPDDPAFWGDWIDDDVARPAGWERATGKQRCVLVHADEQASLAEMIACFLGEEVDGHVMVEIERQGGHARYALRPGREWKPCSDVAAIRAAVPEFAAVVGELVAQGVVEVRRASSEDADFDDAAPLPAEQRRLGACRT